MRRRYRGHHPGGHTISPGAAVETARRGQEGARATGSPPPLPAGVDPLDALDVQVLNLISLYQQLTTKKVFGSLHMAMTLEQTRLRVARLRRDGYLARVGWQYGRQITHHGTTIPGMDHSGAAIWAVTPAGHAAVLTYEPTRPVISDADTVAGERTSP